MELLKPLFQEYKQKALESNPLITTGNVSSVAFNKAIENDVLLSAIDFETAENTKFTKPVLKVYTSVENGMEGTQPVLSVDPVFISQTATFDKLESQVQVTNEMIQDSGIDIVESLNYQIGAQQAVKMQNEALNHATFGIGNGLIDRANNFALAELPDDTRPDHIFQVQYSGIDAFLGTESVAISRFIMGLIQEVPSRYQNDVVIYMGRNTWFDKVFDLFETETIENTLTQDNNALTFKGYPVVILDNIPTTDFTGNPNTEDLIIVGSLRDAFMGVPLMNSEYMQDDVNTIKGSTVMYHTMRYSFITLDNRAIRVGLLRAQTP